MKDILRCISREVSNSSCSIARDEVLTLYSVQYNTALYREQGTSVYGEVSRVGGSCGWCANPRKRVKALSSSVIPLCCHPLRNQKPAPTRLDDEAESLSILPDLPVAQRSSARTSKYQTTLPNHHQHQTKLVGSTKCIPPFPPPRHCLRLCMAGLEIRTQARKPQRPHCFAYNGRA